MNYFELFNIEPGPAVEPALLSEKYFELQKKYHPDFYTRSTEDEKEEVLKKSAGINNAYTIFRDSDKTLEYFLQLSGTIQTGEKYELPPGFLMEMMELNEELSDENESIPEKVDAYMEKLKAGIMPVIENFSGDASELEQLKEYFYKKKYLKRILDRLGD